MKIDNTLAHIGNPTVKPASAEGKLASAPPSSATVAGDERIDISALSARLQGAGEAPVDARKVAEIRQAIAEGRFQIHPERIAASLIEGVRELLSRQR
ncbi:MAG: flagellar biosynthesis anti-sigma factor FlgM [Rhodocyclaceae bacterium]